MISAGSGSRTLRWIDEVLEWLWCVEPRTYGTRVSVERRGSRWVAELSPEIRLSDGPELVGAGESLDAAVEALRSTMKQVRWALDEDGLPPELCGPLR
jgi:hypothetical protein